MTATAARRYADGTSVLSEDLYAKVQDSVLAEPLRRIHVKGRKQDVMVYRLSGLRDAARGTA